MTHPPLGIASFGALSELLLPSSMSRGSLVLFGAGVWHVPGGERRHGRWALPGVANAACSGVLWSVPRLSSPLWPPPDLYPLSSQKAHPSSRDSFCFSLDVLQTAVHFLTHLFLPHSDNCAPFLDTSWVFPPFLSWLGRFPSPASWVEMPFSVCKSLSLGNLPHTWIFYSFLQSDHLYLLI